MTPPTSPKTVDSSAIPKTKTRSALLVVNLGTPDSPDPAAVKKYLAEFLDDPRVLDMPTLSRKLLLHGAILRTRPKESSEAYQKIWTDEGSPLLFHGEALVEKLRQLLHGQDIQVELAMRYQSPSIKSVLKKFDEDCISSITVFLLFPQWLVHAQFSSVLFF